jgi:hypothetical protein
VDVTKYFSGSKAIDYKDFTAIPGFIESINANKTQQFGVLFDCEKEKRLNYLNCFNEVRYSWGHTVHAEHITVVKKSIASITDEHAIEAMKLFGVAQTSVAFITHKSPVHKIKEVILRFSHLPSQVVDYIRLKGYASPWMGLSVVDQVKYGWIKLTS